jgi:hypothetical protein
MVTVAPPCIDPELGETEEMVGAPTYEYALDSVSDFPSVFVMRTDTTPVLATDGAVASNCVELTKVTCGESTLPKRTSAPGRNPLPTNVTTLPPAMGPLVGVIEVTLGAGVDTYVNAFDSVPVWLSGLRTVTDTVPEPPGVVAVI